MLFMKGEHSMREVKKVKLNDNIVFGDGIVYVQSMLNRHKHDIEGNVIQAQQLKQVGCDIIRVSVPDEQSLELIKEIKRVVDIPLVADIHFNYKLALKSIEYGIDKIRINPGNIGDEQKIEQVVSACKSNKIPIRIGVNGGSLERHILEKYGSPTADALVESAMYHIELLEKFEFDDIVVSMKSSNVKTMIDSYRILATKCNYPLHLGVTEAGTLSMGVVKNAIGIGSLLCDGIGDTIRVSLTADPIEEITAGNNILKAVGKHRNGATIISCPTCGRTEIDLIQLANKVEDMLIDCDKRITVAVMGCVVNGPGEAKEADIGVAGGKGCGVIFKHGEVLCRVDEKDIISRLQHEINKL